MVGWLLAGCTGTPPASDVVPLMAFDCQSRYPRRPWVDGPGPAFLQPVRDTVQARNAGQARSKLEADVRREWTRSWGVANAGAQVPAFPGVQETSCTAIDRAGARSDSSAGGPHEARLPR